MSGRPKKSCYTCGAPCTNKQCQSCLHRGKYSGLSIRKNRRKHYLNERRRKADVYVAGSEVKVNKKVGQNHERK